MKQQHNSRTMPSVFGALLLAITCFALQPVVAQTTIELEDYLYQYTANGSYQELLIPESTQATYLYLKVKGGDGGHSVHHDGGIGVTTEGMFEIGTGSNQIRPGSILRIIPGRKGNNNYGGTTGSDRGSGGGGGGGSAVVVLPAGKTNWDSESIVMMVAGGGGGGGSTSAGRPGNTSISGSGGLDPYGNVLTNGGPENMAGSATSDASGGAAMDHAANLGGASCNSGYDNPVGARKGYRPAEPVVSACVRVGLDSAAAVPVMWPAAAAAATAAAAAVGIMSMAAVAAAVAAAT